MSYPDWGEGENDYLSAEEHYNKFKEDEETWQWIKQIEDRFLIEIEKLHSGRDERETAEVVNAYMVPVENIFMNSGGERVVRAVVQLRYPEGNRHGLEPGVLYETDFQYNFSYTVLERGNPRSPIGWRVLIGFPLGMDTGEEEFRRIEE